MMIVVVGSHLELLRGVNTAKLHKSFKTTSILVKIYGILQ